MTAAMTEFAAPMPKQRKIGEVLARLEDELADRMADR
jgi:hypothetical protein